MGARKQTASTDVRRKRRPAMSEEARENQLIADAYDLVAERIRNGTASSAETVHFLKLGSTKERLAREKDEEEIKLLKAKTEALESQKKVEELYINAMTAMKSYQGGSDED